VFGVAAAAFHALTGVAPWNAATPADTLGVAADGHLPDMFELAPNAPPALMAVVARGLAADPHDRGSAAAFALDLRHACRPEPVRLPTDGVPDADLGRTGRGPRTELTHQVPGRRRHAAPVEAVPPRGRWPRRRREPTLRRPLRGSAIRRLPVVVASVAVCAVCVVVASHSAAAGRPAPPRNAVAAGPAAVRPAGPGTGSASVPRPTGVRSGAGPADTGRDPGSLTGWQEVIADLYGRRAAVFAAPDADGGVQALAGVYAPGSRQQSTDEAKVRALAQAGEMLRGFAPTVVEVTQSSTAGDRAELRLVDRWARYDVVSLGHGTGMPLRTGPARPPVKVHMVLVRTAAGWRIADVERLA
jgi:hypothetical protein